LDAVDENRFPARPIVIDAERVKKALRKRAAPWRAGDHFVP
jgi:hypothetical protein